MFRWLFAAAVATCVYFLYKATVNQAPTHFLYWAIGAAITAKCLALSFKSSKEQLEYVDQLMAYGYTHSEATSAWETASSGGSNLLLNRQQSEKISDIESPVAGVPDDDERSNNRRPKVTLVPERHAATLPNLKIHEPPTPDVDESAGFDPHDTGILQKKSDVE